MEKLKLQTHNIVDENIKKIAELFPNCLTERLVRAENSELRTEMAIDFDMLRQELSKDIVEGPEERYQFTWPDKRNAIRLANAPTTDTLRPCREESVDFDNTQNLYIEGDNLEVLKLLRENYLGKVKMIYIDPPYNTGNDFVYNDSFRTESLEFRAKSGNYDEEGNLLTDVYTRNTESNGRFHTDWLNMIYPRLKVAKDLLSEDGVIFISIDDNEVNNAIKACDDVFGAINKIASLITINNPRGRQSDTFYATVHEYLLCYCRNREKAFINGMPLTDEQRSEYSYSDENGCYRLLGLRQRGSASLREDRPDMFFPIYVDPQTLEVSLERKDGWSVVIPKKSDGREGRWMWGKQKCLNEIHRLVPKLISRRNEFDIFVKDYLNNGDTERTRKFKSVLDDSSFNNQNGTQEVKALLEGEYMSFPKSMEYIKTITLMGASHDSLVLDFFSGSATTAHAVMQLNAEDGGNRKFIMVQLPEATDEKSEAYKAGYKNICEIGKERIRRAGVQILELSIKNLEKEKVIEKYARELSEIRSLEEVYGLGGNGLSVNQKTAEGGDIRTGRANAESSSFNTIEHSGGAIQGHERICPVFESGKGITSGTGDTIVDLRTLEVLNKFGYRIRLDAIGGNQQNDLFFDYTSHLQNLSSKLSVLSSDFGFRVMKLDSSNMQDVYYSPEQFNENLLFEDNIKHDRTDEDLLFQAMIELGIELSAKIEILELSRESLDVHDPSSKFSAQSSKTKVYNVNNGYLMACFDKDVNETAITEIARQHPYYFVLRDSSLATDNVADNFEQIWEEYSKETIRRII